MSSDEALLIQLGVLGGNEGMKIGGFNASQCYELAVALAGQSSLIGSKIGLLGPMSGVDKAHFFETVAQNRGARIRVFTDFEEAITWLILREQAL